MTTWTGDSLVSLIFSLTFEVSCINDLFLVLRAEDREIRYNNRASSCTKYWSSTMCMFDLLSRNCGGK